jgi:hypothetical protein
MNLGIAFVDLLAASFFLTAAVVCTTVSRLTTTRTRLWPYITVVYLLLFLERALNSLEWGLGDGRLAFVDGVEDYLSVAACLILLYVSRQFIGLIRSRPDPTPR